METLSLYKLVQERNARETFPFVDIHDSNTILLKEANAWHQARALVSTIRPGPGTWYNLCCPHALLGDTDRALDLLDQELSLNHATEESRNRQRAWAAEDPDLASLRDSPRFLRLVRQR